MLVLDGIMQICLKRLLSTDAHSLQGLTCTAYWPQYYHIIQNEFSIPFLNCLSRPAKKTIEHELRRTM